MQVSRPVLASAVTVVLAFGCVGLPSASGREPEAPESLADLETALTKVSERVQPAIVQIYASGYSSARGRVKLLSRQRSNGSGFLVTDEGHVVTNAHVVLGADRIQVRLPRRSGASEGSEDRTEGKLVEAEIIGVDIETDLAVLRIPRAPTPYLEWGDSSTVHVGQPVLAFGSPLGLDGSVTFGIVSAVDRQIATDDPRAYLQTDAAISPGNSGGPLVDIRGRVVGINTLLVSQRPDGAGPGLAIPSRVVQNVVTQLIDFGRVRRGDIGVRVQTVTPELREALGIAASSGALVADVFPGSPADRAGLRPQDVIVKLEGHRVGTARALVTSLYEKVGGQVTLELVRDGKPLKLRVDIAERVDDPADVLELVNPRDKLVDRLDVLAVALDDRLRRMLPGLRSSAGLIIADVGSDNPAQLIPGDVIVQIGRKPVSTRAELDAELELLPAPGELLLRIERDGVYEYVVVELD